MLKILGNYVMLTVLRHSHLKEKYTTVLTWISNIILYIVLYYYLKVQQQKHRIVPVAGSSSA